MYEQACTWLYGWRRLQPRHPGTYHTGSQGTQAPTTHVTLLKQRLYAAAVLAAVAMVWPSESLFCSGTQHRTAVHVMAVQVLELCTVRVRGVASSRAVQETTLSGSAPYHKQGALHRELTSIAK